MSHTLEIAPLHDIEHVRQWCAENLSGPWEIAEDRVRQTLEEIYETAPDGISVYAWEDGMAVRRVHRAVIEDGQDALFFHLRWCVDETEA